MSQPSPAPARITCATALADTLDAAALWITLPCALDALDPTPARAWLTLERAPLGDVARAEETRQALRALLRHGRFRPRGRDKPASEYLVKAVEAGRLSPDAGINALVDACNAASLHSGLPISVVDGARLDTSALHIRRCPHDTAYVFNPSGQSIQLDDLITLHDAQGPCANPVKDSQRTKTHADTTCALTVVWGARALPDHTEATVIWYAALLEALGCAVARVPVTSADVSTDMTGAAGG